MHFLLCELSMAFYIFHRHRVCLVDHVDLICSLYSWWEGFGSSSLATLPLGFTCGFISTSACGSSIIHQGLLLSLPWRTWICPCEGQVQRWSSCLGSRGSGSTRYSEELAARAKVLIEGYDNQYWPMCFSILTWRTPTEKPARP